MTDLGEIYGRREPKPLSAIWLTLPEERTDGKEKDSKLLSDMNHKIVSTSRDGYFDTKALLWRGKTVYNIV